MSANDQLTSDRKIRIGLIGAGWIGCHHAANVKKSRHGEIVAVADPKKEKAVAALNGQAGKAQLYSDYEDLLRDENVEAVVIASPNALHAEHAIAAAEARKHLYLEKPMAIKLEDCRCIVKAVRESGVICEMGYHRRLNPLYQYAKQLLDEGKLGQLVFAESDYVHHIPGDWDIWEWAGKKDVGGSPIHGGTGHNVDLLRYFCGEVAEVGCFKDVRMPRKVQMETEDIAVIMLRFENGILGRVLMFIGPIVPFQFTLRLFGTKGTVDNNRVWFDNIPRFADPGHEKDCIELPLSWIPDNVQGGVSETWDQSMETFIENVRLHRRPFNDEVSGFNTAAVCFAAAEAAVDRRLVRPERI